MGEGHRSRIDGAERTANHDSRFVRNCLVLTRARTRARLVDPELQLHGRADTHFARVGIGNAQAGYSEGKKKSTWEVSKSNQSLVAKSRCREGRTRGPYAAEPVEGPFTTR